MITYDYPDLFITDGTTKDILITDGTVTVVDDAYVVSDYTVKFNNNDLENEAFELYQNLCSEQDLQIGFCGTGKITFSVRKHYVDSILGTEVTVYLIPNHDASKMLQIGVFKIAEDKSSDNYNRHVITAYDAMYDILNADVTDWYDDILQDEEATCYMDDFRDTFLNQFGVEAESTTLINDGLVLRRTIEKDRISGAEIIKAICEINGCFGTITNEGKFRFKSLAPSIISAADLDTIAVSKYIDISYAEHGFKSIKKVKIVRDNKTIVTSSQTATGDYNVVTIAYNPLVADYTEADLQTVANTLCDALQGHIYLPCTVNAIGNPLHEVGDPIEIVTKYGFDVITYILERRLKGVQALRDTYTANGEEYLSENLNSSYTQSRSTESAISQLSQSASSSGVDFVETIRNIGFRLLDEPSNVSVVYDEDNVEVDIKWTDPDDIATSEPVTATWAGTVVVRKEGSAPRHRWDGTLITDSTTRNQYSSTALVDNTIVENKTYYYGIFPYDTKGDYRFTKVVSVTIGELPIPSRDTWVRKTWNGISVFRGENIWTDGVNIYYSDNGAQYILDKSTSTWSQKTWNNQPQNGLTGRCIWTDGTNIYHSLGAYHYVLDTTTSTWVQKTWNINRFSGEYVWTDGDDIYYSYYVNNTSYQYVLNKTTGNWDTKTWNGFSNLIGSAIWKVDQNIYYSRGDSHYVLDKTTSTWSVKSWNGLASFSGEYIWRDGNDIYYSYGDYRYQFVLDKSTSTWIPKEWTGLGTYYGKYIWSDGTDIYYSYENEQYVLTYSAI